MNITVWVESGTWPACIDAARDLMGATSEGAEVTLIHVIDTSSQEMAEGAFGGLMGRGRRRDPGEAVRQLSEADASSMLQEAAERLDRPSTIILETGRPERLVTAAADSADCLVLGRDGDRSRLGPKSLGPHTRFVVDHAPCRVLLIWPEQAPDLHTLPPPPPH